MLLNLLGQNAHFIGRARYFFWIRHRILTLRISLVIICLFLTATSALLLQTGSMILGLIPVVLVTAVAGFLLIYYNLESSLLVILIFSTVLHSGIGTGSGTPITLTLILLTTVPLVWILKMVAVERRLDIRPNPSNIPGLLFMVTVVIAVLWSSLFVDDDVRFLFLDKVNPRAMNTVTMIVSVLAYFMFANQIRSLGAMKFFVSWFIAVGGVIAVLRLTTGIVQQPLNDGGQFSAFVSIFAFGQMLFNTKIPRILRLVLLVVGGVWVYITFFLGVTWLSGWLPTGVGLLVMLSLRSWKLLVIALVVLAVVLLMNPEFITSTFDAENEESGVTRTAAWSAILELTDDHLLFGMGPTGYYMYYMTYGFPANLSHNNYLDILAQTGLVGIILWLWFWIGCGIMALRTYLIVPRWGFMHGLAGALLAAYPITMLAMMLGDWIFPFPYTQSLAGIDYTIWHWMIAGLTAALYHTAKASSEGEHNKTPWDAELLKSPNMKNVHPQLTYASDK